MADDLNTEIKIGADASGVEAGVGRAKRSLKDLGESAKKAGQDAGAGIGAIGAGGDKAAKDVERATKSMQGSLQRLLAEQKAGAKGSREYYEALADTRGISRNAIKPILDQIDAAKSKTLQAKTAADSWTASLGKVGPLVAAAFSGAAITGFLGKVVSVQREFDVLNSSLKTVTGSSAAAEREMAWLKDFAKETPFGLAQATQGFVKMKALGLDPTRAALTSFGNTASAMGKDLNQMIEAVADASTGEFERLKEFGIKAKKEGDQVSLTFQGVTTTIQNSAADITKYLENIGNVSFGGAMEERAKTLDGTIAALGDTWDELFRTVSTNNVGSLIFDSVTLANGALEDATTLLRAMGGAAQDASRDTGALSTIQNGIATVFETVAVLGANLKYVLVQIGNEIGGLAAQVAQAAQFNFSGVAAIRRQMVADAEAARREIDATTERILNARKAQEEYARYATRNASAATDPRRIDLGKPGGDSVAAPSKPTKAELSDYDKLIQKLGQEIPKAAAEAEAAQMGYNKAQTEFLALAASPAWAKFTNAQRATVAALFENKIASEQSADAAKTLAKANLDAAASREKYLTSLATGLDKIQADIAAQIEATERMGLSKEAIAELDAAKLEMLATDLELQAIKAMDRNLDQQTYDALKKQAAAYRELGIAKKGGAAKEAALDMEKSNAEAAKKAQEDWERAAEQINSSLTDALLRGFESGKGFAENLRQTVVNMFKTMVLRPVISAIVNPVAGALTGAIGLSGAANAGQSALSTIGTGASIFNAGSALGGLGAVGGAMSGFATAATASVQSLLGMSGTVAQMTTSLAAAGHTAAAGVSAGVNAFQAIPGWGWAIGAVAALAAIFGKKATPHAGAASTYSEAGGLVSGADIYRASGLADVRTYNAGVEQVTGNVAKAIGDTLNSTAKAFGKTAGYEITTAFADDSSKDGAWGSLIIKQMGEAVLDWRDTQTSKWAPKEFADGEAGSKEYLAAVAKSARDALVQAIGSVDWAADMLKGLGDTVSLESLAQTVQQINAAKAAFVGFGQYLPVFAAQSDAAVSALVKASGGAEALAGNMSTFVDAFYSDAEKLAVNTANVRTAIEALGLEMPTTKDAMHDLVKEQIALGTEGATAAAGLLAVSGAFAQLQDAAAQLRSALGSAFDQLAQSLDTMHGDVSKADKRVADARMEIWSGYADAQQRVIDLEMQAADATRSFAQSLRSFIGDMATGPQSSMGLESRYRTLQQQLQQTAAQAGAGDQGARDRLTGVASSYLDASRSRSSTSVDYARDAARVRVMLGNLASTAEADPLVAKYDAESLTIQQQIADAQIDVVKYLALMEATGVSTDLGIQTVDKTLAEMRDEYMGAAQAQAAANLRLDVALAALDTLGLTEDMVKAIAANQTNSLSAALNVSDEALSSITGALGLTPENVAELGQQFAVEVALLVGQAATDMAATLQGALAFDPSQYNVLRGVLGYDPAIIAPLATALGLSPEAVQQLASQVALQDGAAELLARVADGLPLSPDAAQALQAAAAGVGLTESATDVLQAMRAGLGLTPASAATLSAASAGIGLSAAAADQVGELLGGIMLTPAASDQVRGLLDGIPLAADDRLAVEGMLRGIGFDPAVQEDVTGLLEGIGLRAGVLQSLGTALGISQEAMTAIGVLSNAGSLDAVVKSAYAQVGRSGFGSDVSQIDQEGFDYWRSQLATGAVSMGDFQQRFLQVAAEAPDADLRAYIAPYMKKLGIPGFAVGTNYVTDDMLAVVHKGEAIVPKAYNPAAGGGGSSNAEMVAELRAMRAELAELRAIKSELAAINRSSSTTATGMTGIVNKQVTLVTEAA